MRRIIFILFLMLSAVYSRAQTIDSLLKTWEQNSSLINESNVSFYQSPGLKTWMQRYTFSNINAAYFTEKKDVYLPQLGKGSTGFSVQANSFNRLKNKMTLWGKAYYQNEEFKSVNYNETLDYELIYPYAMVDTVGGDLKTETYHFTGGVLKHFRQFNIGFEGAYTGKQAYRRRDPRPENISSKIDAAVSISKKIMGNYMIALDMGGAKYHQRNILEFASNLGAPNIYHDAGLGAFNDILDGSNTNAIFNGANFGTKLSLAPQKKEGLSVQLGYDQLSLRKKLSTVVDDIGKIKEPKLNGMIGYMLTGKKMAYVFKGWTQIKDRESNEASFNNRGGLGGIEKIAESVRYTHSNKQYGVEIVAERRLDNKLLSILINSQINNDDFRYLNPNRKLEASNLYTVLRANILYNANKVLFSGGIQYGMNKNLSASYIWPDVTPGHVFYKMLQGMYGYYSTNYNSFGINGRVDIPTSYNLGIFINLKANFVSYKPINGNGSNINLSTGISF